MFKFITRRPLWVNILAAFVLTLLILFLVLKMLGWITKHGEYLTVPAVIGKKTDDAIAQLKKEGFDVQIQDSIFTDTAARGIVLKQLPDPNATVKVNRTVYLTVNRVTLPMVEMPKLEDQSLNFALDILRRSHLQLGDTIFKPSFQIGSVIEQQYNGVRIAAKTQIPWGSKITLIVASGNGEQMLVPNLVGMTFKDAKAYLEGMNLTLGATIAPGVTDTPNAYVYRQGQERFDAEKRPRYIQAGQVMDLYLSIEMPKDSVDIKQP